MKFNKFFMLAMAGLAMTACSNDEIGNNLSGNGVVEVQIVAPQTRALVNATEGNNNSNVKVEGPITVKLTATQGSAQQTIDLSTGSTHTVKFYNVQGPQQIEAWVNGGDVNGKGETNIDNVAIQVLPEKIPAYGSSTTFNLTGTTETNEGKKYEMYKTTVTMEIPVARLEISGITHKHADQATACKYKQLTIDGIYLDKVANTKNSAAVDYSWDREGRNLPILRDEIVAPNDFLKGDVWPAVAQPAQAYAYNFYPNSQQMPVVKIYFDKAVSSDDANPVSAPRYAVIKSYNGETNFQFQAGKIYRITKVDLDDKNIIGDEEGNTLYGVDVTVTEAQWTVVDLTGEWAEQ